MKAVFAVLTMSVACTLAGCNSDQSKTMTVQDMWHEDPNAVATLDQNIRHDKRPTTQYPRVDAEAVSNTKSVATYANTTGYDMNGQTQASAAMAGAAATNVLNSQDQQFVLDVAAGGLYEVQSSHKALVKSTDANVKSIAQHTVDDYTRANSTLTTLAQRKGMSLSSLVPNASQTQMLTKLDGLAGTEFDREYITQQRLTQTDLLAKYQSEATNGTDPDLRDYASAILPAVRSNLQMINGNSNIGNER